MRVHFDDQIFNLQTRGGISRYFVELMSVYDSDSSLGVKVTAPRFTKNEVLLESGRVHRVPRWLNRRRVIHVGNRFCQSSHFAQVIHHTYYNREYLKRVSSHQRRVITIYDMIPELFPEMFPEGSPHFDKLLFVQAADLILCISETTKRDLVKIYGTPPAPIVVTPLDVGNSFLYKVMKAPLIGGRYVLFVGTRIAYKDFGALARAFANCGLPKDVRLAAIGGGPWLQTERTLLNDIGISDRAFQVDLDDEGLARAYAHALCLVSPSRYEGFGLPALEAMASGCPTILANASALAEVGGDAALYFTIGDHDELARLIYEVAVNDELRAKVRDAGLRRSAGFSWQQTARVTANAYRAAIA